MILEKVDSISDGMNRRHKLSLDSIVTAIKDQASCELVDEAVILDFRSGVYYGLDAVGARIWTLMQEPITVKAIRDAVVAEYDVGSDRCENDLFHLIEQLEARGLVEIRNESIA
jgi:hypothetical protein